MTELAFFDACCRIGSPMNPAQEFAPDWRTLAAELDRVGVGRALIGECGVSGVGGVFSNALLAEELAVAPPERAVGMWELLPECCEEQPVGDALFAAMAANKIRALEILPGSHRWVPRRAVVGRRFEALAERRIPVTVAVAELGSWNNVYELAERFPRNLFIITGVGLWGCDRNIRPLLREFEHVFIETSEYWVAEGLPDLVNCCGGDKILFGSGYPRYNHGQQMMNIRRARIADSDRAAIASGNLDRLLSEVKL